MPNNQDIKLDISTASDCVPTISIYSLPNDVLREVGAYLQRSDFIALGIVSKRFHYLFGDARKLACDLAHKLHTHVVRGEKEEAENLLKLFPSLLTVKGTVIDYSGRTIFGTALQIALGAEDVSQEGKCVLITRAPPFTQTQMNQINFGSPAAYVRCEGKLFYIDKTNNEFKEIPLNEATLMQFDAENHPQIHPQILSEAQLKNITFLTGHIHDEGMVQMLQRYLRKLPNGDEMIVAQTREQFPGNWEEIEKARAQRESDALNKVFTAIANSQIGETCEEAIKKFKTYLEQENKGNDVIKTGKHFNHQLLAEAFKLYEDNFDDFGGWNSRKNHLAWRKVIGGIQRWLPAATAMALTHAPYNFHAPYNIVVVGEKLKRSLEFRFDRGYYFYPLDLNPRFRLGEEYAVAGNGMPSVDGVGLWEHWIYKLCRTKSINVSQLIPLRRDKSTMNPCAII